MSLPALLGTAVRMIFVISGAFLLNRLLPPPYWGWDIHDLIYQRMPLQPPDTQIVIVDIGRLGRIGLGELVHRIGAAKPKFIAIDAVFPEQHSPLEDSLWKAALCEVSQQVPICLAESLALEVPFERSKPLKVSLSRFTDCTEEAFANLLTEEPHAVRTVRRCLLYAVTQADTHYSLALRAALALDPDLRAELPRIEPQQRIRYRGNLSHFYYLNGLEVLHDSLPLEWLGGKVVFMGLADPLYLTMEDVFFSPLHPRPFRQAFPDMYGVIVHANILSMLMHRSFFRELSVGWALVLVGVGYLLFGAVRRGVRVVWLRYFAIRAAQALLTWGAFELMLYLGKLGLWFPVEVVFWGLLLAGEVALARPSHNLAQIL